MSFPEEQFKHLPARLLEVYRQCWHEDETIFRTNIDRRMGITSWNGGYQIVDQGQWERFRRLVAYEESTC